MTANLLCPVCFNEGRLVSVKEAATALSMPGWAPYTCPLGHEVEHPRVREPGDVEAARRERIAEVMPHHINTAARDD